ncbi:arginine N-succinyltransferase [Paraburkholderia denitrificans]|uniref:Arginine N-succinyltransferase n=1 Tax=Paraburkholderia denitrificans TaxID=694025 RepID=A0ABW0JA93_9BURK
MWITRPARDADAEKLLAIAAQADPLVHTFPRDRASIEDAIARTNDALSLQVDVPCDEYYLMVLEDPAGDLRGAAAICSAAGSGGAFFVYRNDVIHHVSRDLKISNSVHALTLCSDLTHHSQLQGFFIGEGCDAPWAASLLSRSRLMFAARDRQRFGEDFVVSLAGCMDQDYQSPFWNAIGRKFFDMDLISAERMIRGARNGTLIVEVMPHYPVYVPLLPNDVRALMGQMHSESNLPFEILEKEGFRSDRYIDIFDGGPILVANASQIRTIAEARTYSIDASEVAETAERYLVANVGAPEAFRCVVSRATPWIGDGYVALPKETLDALCLSSNDSVIVAPM